MLRSLIAVAVLCAPAYGADYLTGTIRAQQGIANLGLTNAQTEAIKWGGPIPLNGGFGGAGGATAYLVQNGQRDGVSVTGKQIIVCTYEYERTRFQRYWEINETTLCPNQLAVR